MKAMILAAGRGERMRPLTDHTPKPLLPIHGKPLIEYHLERLREAGYQDIVINIHHLGEQIKTHLGDGHKLGLSIHYSIEQDEALETGGGIFQALPLLGDDTFLVINGDIWTECDLTPPDLSPSSLGHLILIDNPPHNPAGDFGLAEGLATNTLKPGYTFSGIGWYRPELFTDCHAGKFPLAPILREAIDKREISAQYCDRIWVDVGTVERLEEVEGLVDYRGKGSGS